jgi:hypothetical protein
MRNVFLALTLFAGVLNLVIFILVAAALDRRGTKTNMLLARVYMFKYLKAYKEATRKETGRTGALYGLWLITINLTLVFALAAVFAPHR